MKFKILPKVQRTPLERSFGHKNQNLYQIASLHPHTVPSVAAHNDILRRLDSAMLHLSQ